MQHSLTIGALASALAAAQAESKRPAMSGINPAFKKDGHGTAYSTMTDYREAASVLAKHKIAVVQAVSTREGNVVDIETMLLHESGEWLSAITSIAANDGRAQSVAGAATYGKRIGISAMIFESGDPDDDGNAASAVQSGVESRRPTPAQQIVAKVSSADDKAALLRAQRIKILIARYGEGFRGYCQLILGREVASGKELSNDDLDKLEAEQDDVE
jgi:hypothetical protein